MKVEDMRVGDIVKSFDFEPIPGRQDRFVVGTIIENDGQLITIKVIADTAFPEEPREEVQTPVKMFFGEHKDRITYLGR